MILRTARRARRAHTCDSGMHCPIRPGQVYLESKLPPGADPLNAPGWTRL